MTSHVDQEAGVQTIIELININFIFINNNIYLFVILPSYKH